jgi:CHAT domain-containing protein/tetratricopeptide (TPR) repeat protein
MRDRVAICFDLFTRPRVLRAAPLILALGLSGCADRAQDPVEIFATQLPVNGDQPASVARSLERGAYLVEVREQEIDLRVVVQAAGTARTLEDRAPRYGAVYRIVSLESPAELRVEISSVDHKTKRGNASVRISRWAREPGAAPGELEAGYRARSEAGELAIAGDSKSWALAADKLYEAVTHFDAAGDDAAIADAAFALAYIQYGPRDQFAAAIRACEMAADAYDDAGDEVGVHNAHLLRAATEVDQAAAMNGETQRAEQRALYAKADRELEESARWFTKQGLPLRAQYATNMRAVRALYVGEYEAAEPLLDQAVAMAKRNEDVREQARSLANLAALHVYMGQSAQAAEEYEALRPLLDRKTQAYQYAALLGNLGVTLIDLGDLDRALAVLNEAIGIFNELNEKSEAAVQQAQLGSLFLRMGDAKRALDTLRNAIEEQEKADDAQPLAGTLRLAAAAAAMLEDHAAALEFLLHSARVDSNPQSVARTRVLIAGELRALGRPEAAAAELVEPLKSTNKIVLASALEERAQLRLAERRTRAAIEDLRAADALYVALGLEVDRIDLKVALSRAMLDSADLAGAGSAADEAIAIVSHIRVKSANPEWRARFLSARYSPYEARIAVDFASANPDSAWRAFRVAEEVRARSLSDELATGGAKLRVIDPEEAALRARLTTLQLRLESSVEKSTSAESDVFALRSEINKTRAQIDAIRNRHGVAASQSSLPESMAQVQGALPRGTAVLAYFVGDSNAYAWLLTRDGLRHSILPGRRKLEQLIVATRLEQRNRSGSKESLALASLLFGDLLDGLKEDRILLLADGPLNAVPFAALPLPREAGKVLVERFVFGAAPSLALAMSSPAHARSNKTRVAVISDPVYAPDDGRLHLAMTESGTNFRGAPKPSKHNFVRLRYSALEASAVVRAFGSEATTQLSGFDAVPERVLGLPFDDLAVLHFATHAVTGGDEPEQSALFLSEYARTGDLQNESEISALDIAQRGLHADVVVLSACGTGDGNALRGEGVLGLSYEFLANGSHSVVASLWPIEDASTARFMNEFYRAYRENGSAAEALRTAQLKMRAAGTSSVWSSFVVRANEFP